MEDKIGEIVTLTPLGRKARIVETKDEDCSGCYYFVHGILCWDFIDDDTLGMCYSKYRKDHKNIIYKPLT